MSLARILFQKLCKIENKSLIFSRHNSNNTINLSDPAVHRYLSSLIVDHENLMVKPKRNPEEVRRLQLLKPIVNSLEQRIFLYDSIGTLKRLHKNKDNDEEMKKMIKDEAEIYLKRIKEVDGELQAVLLEPQLSVGGVLLEVTTGAGGQEAMLFARELFDLYQSYAKYKDWDADIASIEKSDIGGIRKGSMLIHGPGVPEMMRMEAGVHRVQRIPATEKSGRIHTSTVTVAVLPQPSEIEVVIPDRDLTIETKRASGAGGQHVNTTDSAVRIVHNPTGTVVECQEGRSQIKNVQIAMQKLRTLLLQKQQEEQTSKINNERKAQVCTFLIVIDHIVQKDDRTINAKRHYEPLKILKLIFLSFWFSLNLLGTVCKREWCTPGPWNKLIFLMVFFLCVHFNNGLLQAVPIYGS